MTTRRAWPRLALLGLLITGAVLAAVYREHVGSTMFAAWLGSLGPWAPAGYVALCAIATISFVPGATVIDVRGADAFAGPLGHVAGALNLPLSELQCRLTEINALRDNPIVLVCRTDKRSAAAARMLQAAGFSQAGSRIGLAGMKALLIINDPPYGTERLFNALRIAHALLKKDPDTKVTVFLMADSVIAAKSGQKTPDGYYNVERMLRRLLASKGDVLLCGTCMDARGLEDAALLAGARRSTIDELATATVEADKVMVF